MVYMENRLAIARYSLSPRAQMLLFYAISLIDADDVGLNRKYTIESKKFAEWANLDLNAIRRDFYNPNGGRTSFAQEVLNQPLIIPNHYNPERKVYGDLSTHWFASVWGPNNGWNDYIDIEFVPVLVPYLTSLRDRYYRVKRAVIIQFSSRYSMRLYEWLESERFKLSPSGGRKTVSLEELRAILGTDKPIHSKDRKVSSDEGEEKTEYITRNGALYERKLSAFYHFKSRALDVAVKEVNAYSDMLLGCEKQRGNKMGKGVHTITFTIQSKEGAVPTAAILPKVEHNPPSPRQRPEQIVLNFDSPGDEARGVAVPGPTAAPSGTVDTPEAEDQGSVPFPELDELLARLSVKYGLSQTQREKVPELAAQHGYDTEEEAIKWLMAADNLVVHGRSENAGRDFWVALRDNYQPRVASWKLRATKRQGATVDPLPATPVATATREEEHEDTSPEERRKLMAGLKAKLKAVKTPPQGRTRG